MKKTLAALATAATLGVTTMGAPAEAHGWGWRGGPGVAFGLAAGALTAGAIAAATSPYYYGPGYSYGPGYYPGAYAYGGPVVVYRRPHYWRPYYPY